MDPVRSHEQASDALSGADRDARIEQLLLAGLDHYFANSYDQAINLWTRVLFLDRHHDRARAYIDRARSAQAERQRESEALMQQGLDAFASGDVERARQLVGDAIDGGASRDLALGVLSRIERLGSGSAPPPAPDAQPSDAPRSGRLRVSLAPAYRATRRRWTDPSPTRRARRMLLGAGLSTWLKEGATILLVLAAIGAAAVGLWGVTVPEISGWIFAGEARRAAPFVATPVTEPLPLPSANEHAIARGRSLFKSGRLRDALRELDRVPIGDPQRAEADRLRAEIQQELLAAAAGPRPSNEVP